MNTNSSPANPNIPPESLHTGFLSLLPRIETHARIFFRHLRCPDRKEDAVAETIAIAWRWYLRATQRGKDVSQFVSAFASFATRHVRSGRRLAGQDRRNDALSPLTQARRGFTVSPLPPGSTLNGNAFDEALAENTRSEVPDQVAFRCDFPAWRRTRTERDRRLIDDLMTGERTLAVAEKFGMSAGRVSQLRREFHQDWERFCDVPSCGVEGQA
jgi:hypothetical protein